MNHVKCKNCGGYFLIINDKNGPFAGCSSYPHCQNTLSIVDVILEYIKLYGVGVYSWKKQCCKCGKETSIYSYYIGYELGDFDEYFRDFHLIAGLGDIPYLDDILSKKHPTIMPMYSNNMEHSYMANTCPICRSVQEYFCVVEDPHEIYDELFHSRGMSPYLAYRIRLSSDEVKLIETDIHELIDNFRFIGILNVYGVSKEKDIQRPSHDEQPSSKRIEIESLETKLEKTHKLFETLRTMRAEQINEFEDFARKIEEIKSLPIIDTKRVKALQSADATIREINHEREKIRKGNSSCNSNIRNKSKRKTIVITIAIIAVVAAAVSALIFTPKLIDFWNEMWNTHEPATLSEVSSLANETEKHVKPQTIDYILPASSERLLTTEDITDLSEKELMLARNEIYARHGRKFNDEEIRIYFEAQDWYEGIYEPDNFPVWLLSEIEIKNVDFMKSYEDSMF